jgi:hypothetical protein
MRVGRNQKMRKQGKEEASGEGGKGSWEEGRMKGEGIREGRGEGRKGLEG